MDTFDHYSDLLNFNLFHIKICMKVNQFENLLSLDLLVHLKFSIIFLKYLGYHIVEHAQLKHS